ncbi:TetR/AcrR family transcriptional regulator [Kribbella speibonae]|uniref:TetR/AcrR family transcriptional regulator n=1 Tax=Kribbella speibonae TaxID=1572660 RepID=A0A4R0INV0_9ACTN|nr:TetR/AcrR family transcriptional regulator [Kribbella speibonae]TCC35343.1 TetR/AcrR family transcriptional regulator [Kribbella speibonae]
MAPTAKQGQEVRRRLLAAAVELIPERGWSAVSTRILAERAGVTPSVVHYHFSSVQDVLTEAAIAMMREVLAATDFTSAPTPAAAVDAMLGSLERYDGTDPTSLLFTETYLAATRDEHLHAQIAALITDFRTRLADWLAIHQVAEPSATAAVLAATIDGLLLHRTLGPESPHLTTVLRRLVS